MKQENVSERSLGVCPWGWLDTRASEHVVVLGDGGAAIRVRTVPRRAASGRGNPEAVEAISAIPRTQNRKDRNPARSQPERHSRTSKIKFDGDGVDIPNNGTDKRARVREFKITKGILDKFCLASNCEGCGQWPIAF